MIDSISPVAGFDEADRRMAIDIMLQNSTVVESLRDKNVHISAIALMQNGCIFDTCARVDIWQIDSAGNILPKTAQAIIDYPNQKVVSFKQSDAW